MKPNSETSESVLHAEVVVLGGGPGGYSAAFRAADLGKKVTLIERYSVLGGVCLNVGCIPSKALLHMAQIIHEAEEFGQHGLSYGKPALDFDKIRAWKESVTATLTQGLSGLVKQRKVNLVQGTGKFTSPNTIDLQTDAGIKTIRFDQAIIAAGSHPAKIPVFPNDDPRLLDSTDALELKQIPPKLLIVGGGIIGLEMATVYYAFGSEISVVELMNQIIPGCDQDLITPLFRRIKKQYKNIWLETRVTSIEPHEQGLKVFFEGKDAPESALFDAVLVAVGRRPNGPFIDAERAGVKVDEVGFIPVDKQQRTNVSHIFAIGDIVGNPMLAHKASHEGKVAAEVAAGLKTAFDALTIPSVAYTDPEVAWMGLTENQAKQQGIAYDKAAFPWAASGRSLSIGRKEGATKLLCEKGTGRILGAGIVGPNAGELIAEAVVALEMGADAEDIGLSIHPHPTLSETLGFAAEMIAGTITDLYVKKDKP
ncbi:lipoamide dehydrogenase, E3 component is part of three enzyme complexes [Candidatus Methylobacter favarea]|uniref:Dihydrolipoyl dehydrogenase n=1 Tax=Candidatus Methylobacter favarea TaxID=2707345 RepID=A0A8S0WIE8_9GAMM|nr:dihydrolipoyl dehydrogenase [Candidatus Methylobacter favarea]CAA9890504.1 lipoamide dehydrogenase, E3 component is part of three enzyme complexes [Candidatus Methylobacter favarea]